MLRLLVFYILMQSAAGQGNSAALDMIFQDSSRFNNTIEGLKCTGLEGSANECMSCYTCDDNRIKNRKSHIQMYQLKLTDSTCTTTNVCCILTHNLIARTFEKCGLHNPEGDPRRRRPSLRSVLEREYPWRAWVHSANDMQNPLCSATYVNQVTLVTTASCVSGKPGSSLRVKFTKGEKKQNVVNEVIVHENYDAGTRKNNIALLTLTTRPTGQVRSVCLPPIPAHYGTPCIAVSASDTYIKAVIPQQDKCNKERDNSTICTFSPGVELKPQEGEGIFCLEDNIKSGVTLKYMLYGISLNVHKDGVQSEHISVPYYTSWIQDTIKKHNPTKNLHN